MPYACKHPTPMGVGGGNPKEWLQSKKTLNPLHFRGLEPNPHRYNLPLYPFTPPTHTQCWTKLPRGSNFSWCGNVGQRCVGPIIVINKNKQHKNNLWILEKCHGKDLIQNVVYVLKTKTNNQKTNKHKKKKTKKTTTMRFTKVRQV